MRKRQRKKNFKRDLERAKTDTYLFAKLILGIMPTWVQRRMKETTKIILRGGRFVAIEEKPCPQL